MKRDCQEGILEDCAARPRPMRVRKVCTSGTKGVGWGTDGSLLEELDAFLRWVMVC